MNNLDLNEAVNLTNNVILKALLGLIVGQSGDIGEQLNYQCGLLQTNAATELISVPAPNYNLQFFIDLAKCFDAAQALPIITYQKMDAVRVLVSAQTPTGLPAIAVQNFSIRMCLVEQARILAATDFVSRQDIDNFFNEVNTSFDAAQETAANNFDNVAYVALLQLRAAVAQDLANRARPLPKMVSYTTTQRRSALSLSQFLYQDPTRYTELISENKPIHPLFMPITGNALAS